MHELSIAAGIVEIAEEEARRRQIEIEAVYLDLGMLSGVVKEALLYSYTIACDGTPLEGSRLVVKEIPIEVYCPACNKNQTLSSMQWFCCPQCGAPTPDIIHGKEMMVTALEVKE